MKIGAATTEPARKGEKDWRGDNEARAERRKKRQLA